MPSSSSAPAPPGSWTQSTTWSSTASRSAAISGAKERLDGHRPPSALRRGKSLPTGELRASRGGVGVTEELAVGKSSGRHYRASFVMFEAWCQQAGLGQPQGDSTLDAKVVDFLDVLLAEGAPRSEAEYAVCAVKAHFTQFAGRSGQGMPRADRALKGYRKTVPAKSRLPVSWSIASMMVVVMRARGHLEAALQILLMFSAYLRPGEARALRCEDLLAPASDLPRWAVVIASSERDEVSKTQVSDDTLLLDWPPWLGPQLAELKKKRDPKEYLFTVNPAVVRQVWYDVWKALGQTDVVLYQLRHGGASTDVLTKRRPMTEAACRGRWSSLSSLQRYCKQGKLQRLTTQLTPHHLKFARWCEANIDQLFLQKLPGHDLPNDLAMVPEANIVIPQSKEKAAPAKRRRAASGSATKLRRPAGRST